MVSFHLNFSPYLPLDAAERMRNYKYHGEDRSYIFKYMWRPLVQQTVPYIPRWIAPNTITVGALVPAIISHALLWYYMPDLTVNSQEHSDSIPRWIFVFAALSMLVYQFMDNCDGAHARRLGVGSPLGLLMDHGCDAFNSVLGTIAAVTACCVGHTWKPFICVLCAVVCFFANTWEEYYRGALILPVVNGANEGIFVVIALYLATAVYGPIFWLTQLTIPANFVPDISRTLFFESPAVVNFVGPLDGYNADGSLTIYYNTIFVAVMFFTAVFTSLSNGYQVFLATRELQHGSKFGSSWLCKNYPFIHALTRLMPLYVITALAVLWLYISPVDILVLHPRLCCWTIGLLYTKLCIHLMIAHLNSIEFHPFRRTMVPFFYIGGHSIVSWAMRRWPSALHRSMANPAASTAGSPWLFDEEALLFEFFALSVVTFSHLAINAIAETASALNISVFTVPKEKQIEPPPPPVAAVSACVPAAAPLAESGVAVAPTRGRKTSPSPAAKKKSPASRGRSGSSAKSGARRRSTPSR